MFAHNKRLQYTVRVSEPNPALANLMLEQFGGPQGELAAAMRYFTQAVSEDDPGRKDMLYDIATEELSHLEIIGHIVAMLNKGAKGRLAEAVDSEADMYKAITGPGNDSHITQVLYGAGTPLVNSAGVPWTAAYIDSITEPTADLRSNIAAEARAKIVYERLIALTDDPGVKEALGFLMTREVAHQKSFEKALYAIEPNFPPGKMPADPRFASVYYNMSQGPGEMRGPWNQGADWDFVTDREKQQAVDGGSGEAEVALPSSDIDILKQMAMRTMSDPMSTPRTGAELGMSMQSDSSATMGGSSGNAMGRAVTANNGGELDDTGMSHPVDKGVSKSMKAMKPGKK
ncbi:manganese catalase family protein [Massilia oculi]|uniref:Manganese catalase family protein n=1 Tax=Massilia hydrophila TaxID=3044279 RepID=A0ABS7YBN2_9BURK|nr:manganese catalase family protein [Massilia oculi]MCA1855684.1 manganese catalase family protein [Massilia oculi]